MKMVYTNENSFVVNNLKNLIEAQNIEVFLKNEFAQGAMGEISPFDAWPEIWVVDDGDYDKVIAIVESAQRRTHSGDWICNQCQESNDASFEVCWNCQTDSGE